MIYFLIDTRLCVLFLNGMPFLFSIYLKYILEPMIYLQKVSTINDWLDYNKKTNKYHRM